MCAFVQYFYRRGIEGRLGLGLGTVLVLISTGTVVAECNRILEETAHCMALLTVPATGYC